MGTGEISVLSIQCCYQPKTALKNKVHQFETLNSLVSVGFFNVATGKCKLPRWLS